jgi:hypothetical protein
MATFIMISRHTPDKCAMYNPAAKKALTEWYANKSWIKHGVKLLGAWNVGTEHQNYIVFEAPSLDALMKAGKEPDFMAMGASETAEVKIAMDLGEVIKMLQQFK